MAQFSLVPLVFCEQQTQPVELCAAGIHRLRHDHGLALEIARRPKLSIHHMKIKAPQPLRPGRMTGSHAPGSLPCLRQDGAIRGGITVQRAVLRIALGQTKLRAGS